jgi:hypothetical protein
MYDDIIGSLLYKITQLAIDAEQPLIIIKNPRIGAPRDPNSMEWVSNYKAGIGDAWAGFDGYSRDGLIELYADLKAGLISLQERRNAKSNQQGNTLAPNTAGNKA